MSAEEQLVVQDIEELQIEIFNQYIFNFISLSKYLKWANTARWEVNIEIDEQKVRSLWTIKDQVRIKKLLERADLKSLIVLMMDKKFLRALNYKEFIKNDNGSTLIWDLESTLDSELYNEIRQDMLNEMENENYIILSNTHGYGIKELLALLDELNVLKNKVNEFKVSVVKARYKEIFNQYVLLVSGAYGFKNPKLKTRIKKARNLKGNYQKLVDTKNKLLLSILAKQAKENGKWKNPSEAIRLNLTIIEQEFEKFDKNWLKKKIKETDENLKNFNKLVRVYAEQKEQAEETIRLLEKALNSKVYPCKDGLLTGVLPYHCDDMQNVLIKSLRNEGKVLEKILEQGYFKK